MRVRSRYTLSNVRNMMVNRTRISTGVMDGGNTNTELSRTELSSITDRTRSKRDRIDRAKAAAKLAAAERRLKGLQLKSFKSELYTGLLTVNPCIHTTTKVFQREAPIAFMYADSNYTYLRTYDDLAGFRQHVAGTPTSRLNNYTGMSHANAASSFYGHDWFALLDRWHEAFNSLMPPSSLLGESIVENAIFVDAFKTILNPSRGLKFALEFIKGNLGSKRHTPLGKVGRLVRDVSDANLGYQFGVKPAIEEINKIIGAHRVVAGRMKFLRENVGGYVPIRVRQVLPSEVTTEPDVHKTSVYKKYISRESTAVISGLGKVRPDLDYAKDWHAYVQYFGLHKAFGLAWELVPFSFVVDWVTNAGDYINKYMTPRFDAPFCNVRNICHSIKKETTTGLFIGGDYFANGNPGSACELFCGKTTEYVRNSGLPTTSGSVDFSRLGLFHGITGGSLLLQKGSKLF